MTNTRVAVFIDNSNIFKGLLELHNVDSGWCKKYDPLYLSQKLAGERDLVKIFFYCTPPPSYLEIENEGKYTQQMSYYSRVEQKKGVEVKYGRLSGPKGAMVEKNLDTQMCTDMVALAAQNEYDVAIIVANDGDYVSAAEMVKNFGKKVENAYFKGKGSMDLRSVCDVPKRLRQSHFVHI